MAIVWEIAYNVRTYLSSLLANIVWSEHIQKKREGRRNSMTGEPEMIQLESDHGGIEVQERSFQPGDVSPCGSSAIKSKRKRKMADKDKKEKQVKKIKKEPEEGTETLLDKWLHSYKPSTIQFNEREVVSTTEPQRETFTTIPLKGILKQAKFNSKYKVAFNCFVKTKSILKNGRLSTRQKIRCLVEEEDLEMRESFFKTKRKQQKELMRQRHLLRKQEATPRRVRLVTHILKTLKKFNV